MLEVTYDNTLEDLREFLKFHLTHVPAGRTLVRNQQLAAGAFGLLLGTAAILALFRSLPLALALGLVVSIGSAILCRPIAIRLAGANAERMLRDSKSEGVLGWHKLTVEGDVLREEHQAGSKSARISSLDGVFEADGYVFVYLSAFEAHIIPRSRVSSGHLDPFVEALRASERTG